VECGGRRREQGEKEKAQHIRVGNVLGSVLAMDKQQ
jgi:hypothetical protein